MKIWVYFLASLLLVVQTASAAPLDVKVTVGGADKDILEHGDAGLAVNALRDVEGNTLGELRDPFGNDGGFFGEVKCVRFWPDKENIAYVIGQLTKSNCPCVPDPSLFRFVSVAVDDGEYQIPLKDNNGVPILDGNGNPVLITLTGDLISTTIRTTGSAELLCSEAFSLSVVDNFLKATPTPNGVPLRINNMTQGEVLIKYFNED